LQRAVEVARELRRANHTRVQVRRARAASMASSHWAILVTTPVLEGSRLADLEEGLVRFARRAPGITLTGWLSVTGSVESVRLGDGAASVRAAARVLIVDSSDPVRRATRDLLELRGYRVIGEADTAAAGFDAVERLKPDAVVLDMLLPDGSGLDLCEVLTSEPDAPGVLLISSDPVPDARLAKARGASGVAPKADLARIDFSSIWG
jgi:two-component system, chemotaxis family, chemotaxis protein CheY